jgi:hypothetical protein
MTSIFTGTGRGPVQVFDDQPLVATVVAREMVSA